MHTHLKQALHYVQKANNNSRQAGAGTMSLSEWVNVSLHGSYNTKFAK